MNRIAVEKSTWGRADANSLNPPAALRLAEIGVPTLVLAGALVLDFLSCV